MNYLYTQNVSFNYSLETNFKLKNINLNIGINEIYGLLGRNGSGKSTLLRILGGHLFPNSGEIFLNQEDITFVESKNRKITTVFQSLALFPHFTVRQNIQFALKHSKKKNQSEKYLKELYELFYLDSLINKNTTELSGGQKQRVALARAMATGADIILLDEPTSALDYIMKDELIEILKQIKTQCKAIVIVSHDRDFILSTCDKIGLLEMGKLIYEGKREQVLNEKAPDIIRKALGL